MRQGVRGENYVVDVLVSGHILDCMAKKKMTLEDLAGMVKRGFDQMATKEDLKQCATKTDLKGVLEEMSAMRADIRYIRSTTDAVVRSDISQDATIQDLTVRVQRLEQKAGIAR